LEHYGLSACRTSLSTQTVEQSLDTSGFSRDRRTATPMMPIAPIPDARFSRVLSAAEDDPRHAARHDAMFPSSQHSRER
ncbi:hypothetical protein, partial [Xanthomonas graminis]|uniref:hypothetical protein n=1 Tax=Xanthomonas graminis TaxID=3390026 RepID=UPI001F3E8FF2